MVQRYLVTGAAGFIGARTTELLLDQGAEAVGLDVLNAAYDVRLKEHRLRRLEGRVGFRFTRTDVDDLASLRRCFAEQARTGGPPFDGVLHFAGYGGVRASVEDPWRYLGTNTLGTLNVLECCRSFGVPKFVFASTSSVYGAATEFPLHEGLPTDRPLSPYAASKKAAETLAYSYHHLHGIDVSVLRFFTVYGPAGRPDMSVFRFIHAVQQGRPITIFGDGTQQRDFTYVDDVARGAGAALAKVGYEVFNLGGDRPYPLLEVLTEIESRLGKKAVVQYAAAHTADPHRTWADVSKAERILGWKPEVCLREGLRRTVDWFRGCQPWSWTVDVGDAPLARAA